MKSSGISFVIVSILVQLALIPILYTLTGLISLIFFQPSESCSSDGFGFYLLTFPTINFIILFATIIITSVQETTKSELLASVMHGVWIIWIWGDTYAERFTRPNEYMLFIFCISLTIPTRILFRKFYHSKTPTDLS